MKEVFSSIVATAPLLFEEQAATTKQKRHIVRVPHYLRPDGPCEGRDCTNIVPGGFVYRKKQKYICSEYCLHSIYHSKPKQRDYDRPDGPCEGPGCQNVVPGGHVSGVMKHYFCSPLCRGRYTKRLHVVGNCLFCDGPVYGPPSKAGKTKYCGEEHEALHMREKVLGPCGPFGAMIEEYLAVASNYRKGTLPQVKTSLSHLLGYAHTQEHLTTLEEITPSVMTRFIAQERTRGMTSGSFIGHASTFFNFLAAEGRISTRNPVVPRIHSQKSKPAVARPYADKDLAFIWNLLEESGGVDLLLAMSIGEESGLRIGEVCNIRLEDVDQDKQTIFVRLPTKNMRTRTVPYHDKVKKYLDAWSQLRNPSCPHDHLLHSMWLATYCEGTLNTRFRKLFLDKPRPARGFSFHRLRHSWATRLMNNGMELAVLKELGGWESWNSMQRYIRVLETTVRRQYEETYRKLQTTQVDEGSEQTFSLMDVALLGNVPEVDRRSEAV